MQKSVDGDESAPYSVFLPKHSLLGLSAPALIEAVGVFEALKIGLLSVNEQIDTTSLAG